MSGDVPATMKTDASLGAVGGPAVVCGEQIGVPTDVDMYEFAVYAGQRIGFDIDTKDNGPPGLGSYLRIFDSKGNELAANNDKLAPGDPPPGANAGREGFDSYIDYTFRTTGTYYVGVSNWQNRNYDPQTGKPGI